jgi:hypothetical protein
MRLVLLARFVPVAAVLCIAGAAHAAPAARGGPALWSVTTQVGAKKSVVLCADSALQAAFVRTMPARDGENCAFVGRPVFNDRSFTALCRVGKTRFAVHAVAQGDLSQNFTVQTDMTAQTNPPQAFTQTLQFKRIGACPADWVVGDTGRIVAGR